MRDKLGQRSPLSIVAAEATILLVLELHVIVCQEFQEAAGRSRRRQEAIGLIFSKRLPVMGWNGLEWTGREGAPIMVVHKCC